jgi:KUP system potassium uptake protein
MKTPAQSMRLLMLGALGVVFGDIGTSPLYTFRECLKVVALTPDNVLGILSLIFWSVTVVVTLKYVFFVMNADNRGEGGILALMALVSKVGPDRLKYGLGLLGLFGAAMFFGDAMITPAISVLSAVEGLELIDARLSHLVLPIALGILAALFLIQKRGTASIGVYFGPAMAAWFGLLALLGVYHLVHNPVVLKALWPGYAVLFVAHSPALSLVVLSSVFLALTGGEALYADMGHFGKAPIQRAWLWAVFPALMLNYFGQGALVLAHPEVAKNPFFGMAPDWLLIPLVLLATVATVIASQAVISGAFSMTKQGVQLGYLPRLTIVHTSHKEIGQIYVPSINTALFVAVVFLVLFFGSSEHLAAAYGIAVASTMLFTTVFMLLVTKYLWNWSTTKCLAVTGMLMAVDSVFVATNLGKVLEGGWFPLVAGGCVFTLMTTWKRGRAAVLGTVAENHFPLSTFIESLCVGPDAPGRVAGTAVYMNSVAGTTPSAFLHNLKHNKVLHQTAVFLTLSTQDVPFVKNCDKLEVLDLGHGCYQVTAKLGFMETPNVPKMLVLLQQLAAVPGWAYNPMEVSFFLTRETVVSTKEIKTMARWRERLFALLSRNAMKAADYFHLPGNRVVELGGQVYI